MDKPQHTCGKCGGIFDSAVARFCPYCRAPMPSEAMKVVDEQAADTGLWCVPQTVFEDELQRALRRLHEAVEGKTSEQCARAVLD